MSPALSDLTARVAAPTQKELTRLQPGAIVARELAFETTKGPRPVLLELYLKTGEDRWVLFRADGKTREKRADSFSKALDKIFDGRAAVKSGTDEEVREELIGPPNERWEGMGYLVGQRDLRSASEKAIKKWQRARSFVFMAEEQEPPKPAEKAAAARTLEEQLGRAVPADYLESVGNRGKRVRGVELFSRKEALAYSSPEDYAPPRGILLIGTHGGGAFYAIDARAKKLRYVLFDPLDWKHPDEVLGSTFAEFIGAIDGSRA